MNDRIIWFSLIRSIYLFPISLQKSLDFMTSGFVMSFSLALISYLFFEICTKGFSQLVFVHCKLNVILLDSVIVLSLGKSLNSWSNYHSLRSTRVLFLYFFGLKKLCFLEVTNSQSAKNRVVNSQNDRKFPFSLY